MFKTIMAGVDGSESAFKAVETAAGLAKTHGADLVLVHVVQVSAMAEQALRQSATAHLEDKPQRYMEQLSQEILQAAKDRAVAQACPAERIVTVGAGGNQAQELIEAAKKREADLVVVGSRGRGRLEGLLLGSVSQKVAALAPCHCLIVH